jgi:tRNA uridine 5-carboxymethylaminomethyl modification enzyme
MKSTWINPRVVSDNDAIRVLGKPLEREYNLFDLLRRPDVSYSSLMSLSGMDGGVATPGVVEQIDVQAKYQGYIERQKDEVAKGLAHESTPIPEDMEYSEVHALSIEVRQKLGQARPETIGQASRVQGVTPAAISLLLVHLKRRKVV